MIGQTFSRLTVVKFAASDPRQRGIRVQCICACGRSIIVHARKLRAGRVKSCGCLSRDHMRDLGKASAIHGHARQDGKSPTYVGWRAMHQRCTNTKHKHYSYYGGRGIRVCDRWSSFENFLADMGERPSGKTLDRIDANGNYEPGNCRWATKHEQRVNRRPVAENE